MLDKKFVLERGIYSKSEKIGGVCISAPKKLAEKVINGDDKQSRKEYVNNEIYDKMAYLLKNMILFCVYLRFKQVFNRIGRK